MPIKHLFQSAVADGADATLVQPGDWNADHDGFLTRSLTADNGTNSTTTNAKVTGLDATLGVGTFVFNYMVRYQAAATTTGVKFAVTHTGTVTSFLANHRFANSAATASDAIPDQSTLVGPFVTGSVGASRAKNDTVGPTASVDVANADMLWIVEGLVVVSATGNLELWHGSEVAAASTVKAGSSLIVIQTA